MFSFPLFVFSHSFAHSTHVSSCGAVTRTTPTSAKPRRAPPSTGPSVLLEKLDCKHVFCLFRGQICPLELSFVCAWFNISFSFFSLFRSGATKVTACGRTPTRWGRTAAGAPGASWAPALAPAEPAFASGRVSATTQREFCSVAPPCPIHLHVQKPLRELEQLKYVRTYCVQSGFCLGSPAPCTVQNHAYDVSWETVVCVSVKSCLHLSVALW